MYCKLLNGSIFSTGPTIIATKKAKASEILWFNNNNNKAKVSATL